MIELNLNERQAVIVSYALGLLHEVKDLQYLQLQPLEGGKVQDWEIAEILKQVDKVFSR